MLDLRLPSGWFFAILGSILLTMAIVEPSNHAELTDANVNLYCGVAMLFFGAFLLSLAWSARKRS